MRIRCGFGQCRRVLAQVDREQAGHILTYPAGACLAALEWYFQYSRDDDAAERRRFRRSRQGPHIDAWLEYERAVESGLPQDETDALYRRSERLREAEEGDLDRRRGALAEVFLAAYPGLKEEIENRQPNMRTILDAFAVDGDRRILTNGRVVALFCACRDDSSSLTAHRSEDLIVEYSKRPSGTSERERLPRTALNASLVYADPYERPEH